MQLGTLTWSPALDHPDLLAPGTASALRAWADADPYVAAGVYARVDVRPFRPVLP